MSATTTGGSGPGRTTSAPGAREQRSPLAAAVRGRLHAVVPRHWSVLFGQVAVGSFVVLVLSGLYLELFFDPSMATTVYDGPYENLRGVGVSHAYDSALAISFEVRGGLFVRQLHNWAASLFVAALLAGLVVAFFSGAFRRPRRSIWVVGVLLLFVGVLTAFTGVLLPDDLLSGTSLRMISGYLLSIPVAGTWLHWMLFGSEFPGTEVIPRLHVAHLVLAVVIGALFAVRAVLHARHGHPQYPGSGRSEGDVVGVRVLPGYAARSAAQFTAMVGVLAAMAAAFQVNPIWAYGPANPAHVSGGSTSPWYFGWVDGAVRLWPAWEIRLGEYTVPPWFWPSMVFLPLSFVALALYPVLESRFTRDTAHHHLLQRPRDVPARTSLGVLVAAFYGCLQLAAATDVLAFTFHLSTDAVFWAGRVAVFVVPALAYAVTYRVCLGLQMADRAVLEHGIETGLVRRLPHGGYVEVHHPLAGFDEHGRPVRPAYRGAPVPKRMNQLVAAGPPAD
ncbi:cytochrome bc1 complex cytochrome b subunit [Pseudonocardia humida]|uniref:Cytochrome bc1 complex cytochrome b subunit n=1 Tax=Pseudonocardia humida TaxID=2800819 RepID=A0ABT0ZY57_9PSEU|nr:cytochrome b N-terminal domain-containing protein [Pseudonocardia humida]MCO1655682.1 ubiquinol-cytochrome c reductase cytochrome b subunit [Pseudonocardia humida]